MTLERCRKCHELIDPLEGYDTNLCLDCKAQIDYEREQELEQAIADLAERKYYETEESSTSDRSNPY